MRRTSSKSTCSARISSPLGGVLPARNAAESGFAVSPMSRVSVVGSPSKPRNSSPASSTTCKVRPPPLLPVTAAMVVSALPMYLSERYEPLSKIFTRISSSPFSPSILKSCFHCAEYDSFTTAVSVTIFPPTNTIAYALHEPRLSIFGRCWAESKVTVHILESRRDDVDSNVKTSLPALFESDSFFLEVSSTAETSSHSSISLVGCPSKPCTSTPTSSLTTGRRTVLELILSRP